MSRHHRVERMAPEALRARNLARFRSLVSWLRHHSRYYRQVIEEHKIDPAEARPEDFPILTKQDVLAHFDDISTDSRVTLARVEAFLDRSRDPTELMDGRFCVAHTSGTSGTVGYAVYDKAAWVRGSTQFTRLTGFKPRKRVAFVGATRGHFAGVSLAVVRPFLAGRFFYNTRPFDINQPLSDLVAGLNEFQPYLLSGYARALRILADAQRAGTLNIAPRKIVSSGEPMSHADFEYVRETFDARTRNCYIASEHLYMAFDRRRHGGGGMYLLEDDLVFELREDCTLVTNLFNRTLPLVRYRMNDVMRRIEDLWHGPYRVVEEIVGRHETMPRFLNRRGEEDFIHPIVLVEFFVKHIKAFQFHLVDRTEFRFLAVVDDGIDEVRASQALAEARRRLQAMLREKEMDNVRFEVERVSALPVDPHTGKFRLVVTDG